MKTIEDRIKTLETRLKVLEKTTKVKAPRRVQETQPVRSVVEPQASSRGRKAPVAQTRARKDGYVGGGVLYGYSHPRNGQTVVNDAEAKVVRQIFDWHDAGISAAEIARRLVNQKVPTKRGKSFTQGRVWRIIRSRGRYSGQTADPHHITGNVYLPKILEK